METLIYLSPTSLCYLKLNLTVISKKHIDLKVINFLPPKHEVEIFKRS